jgi:hypothetical protein
VLRYRIVDVSSERPLEGTSSSSSMSQNAGTATRGRRRQQAHSGEKGLGNGLSGDSLKPTPGRCSRSAETTTAHSHDLIRRAAHSRGTLMRAVSLSAHAQRASRSSSVSATESRRFDSDWGNAVPSRSPPIPIRN